MIKSFNTQGFAFQIRIVTDRREKRDVLALRYRAYRAKWNIPPEASGVFQDEHDQSTDTMLFSALENGCLVGSIRISFSAPGAAIATLPCASHYPVVRHMKALHRRAMFIEVSRLAIDPDIVDPAYRTALYVSLIRACFASADAAEATYILVATKPKWVPFYQYLLGLERIGQPSIYPPGDNVIALMSGHFAAIRERQRAANAFFRNPAPEIDLIRAAVQMRLKAKESAHANAHPQGLLG